LLKLKNPVVFLAAQAKCGKLYMARMLKHTEPIGKTTHERLVRGTPIDVMYGWAGPTEELKKLAPFYSKFTLEYSKKTTEHLWKNKSIPTLKEFTQNGIFVDADTRFLAIYYWLAKKYIHPDSMKILVMRRPLESIAHQHCRHGGYRQIQWDGYLMTFLKNEPLPWGYNNVTVMKKNIVDATPMECCIWYVHELEKRKDLLRSYFPDVEIRDWDMEYCSGRKESWEDLLYWLKLKATPKLWELVKENPIIHLGPDKYNGEITLAMAGSVEDAYKVVLNNRKRPEFML
jgi:hypothetical protein